MEYSYEDIVNDLNEGKIESILFSIKDYSHYKNCKISAFFDTNQIFLIQFRLVDDDSETVAFYKKFKDDYKLFKFGRKGSYTLKQIWNSVQISQINYSRSMGKC